MRGSFLLFLLAALFLPRAVSAQEEAVLAITSPERDQIVQGQVTVTGTVAMIGFASYELAFAYTDDSTNTWFILQDSTFPVSDGELGTWDTTVLTDGDYSLRLRVFLLDGSMQELTVTGLRVRNYTAVPTPTPTVTPTEIVLLIVPTAQLATVVPATATQTIPTPTPLPTNPASLAIPSIYSALGQGALVAILLIFVFSFLLRLRRE